MTEDEMLAWHHRVNGHEFKQTPGDMQRTGKPGLLQSMGLQRVGHDFVTEQQQWGTFSNSFPSPGPCLVPQTLLLLPIQLESSFTSTKQSHAIDTMEQHPRSYEETEQVAVRLLTLSHYTESFLCQVFFVSNTSHILWKRIFKTYCLAKKKNIIHTLHELQRENLFNTLYRREKTSKKEKTDGFPRAYISDFKGSFFFLITLSLS